MAGAELNRRGIPGGGRGWRRLAAGVVASVAAWAAIAQSPAPSFSADAAAAAVAKACADINADGRLNPYQKQNATDDLQCAGVSVDQAAFAANLPQQQPGLCSALSQMCQAGGVVGNTYANPLSARLACGASLAPRCNASSGSAGVVFLSLPPECEAIGLRHAAALVGRPSIGPYIKLLLASDDGREVSGALEPTLSPDPDAPDLKDRLEAAASSVCFDIHHQHASDAADMQAIARMNWPTPAGEPALATLRTALGLDRPANGQTAADPAGERQAPRQPPRPLSDDATLADEPTATPPPPMASTAPTAPTPAPAPTAPAADEPRLTAPVEPAPMADGADQPLAPDATLAGDDDPPPGSDDTGLVARALQLAQSWRDGMVDAACGPGDPDFRDFCVRRLRATYQTALQSWRASDEPSAKKVERLRSYLQEQLDQALAYLRGKSDEVAAPEH